ncbi:ABC-F family ATP-binding cassette domain-containing protein [Nocardioides currus]|uniref:Antibiotic ABC transporter ATP-binding protein n=1 Tax=Nocardioides currus TaxID=2133958 RepID=A0A2R7YTL0_9ACTN|nr:ATP-binding cassette domain-containing protein [Nocardioides currus]PUA79722.1 antibiotic ABC transporter ATP-binding protein [Nocardioides currus]
MPLTPLILTDLSVSYGDRPVLDGIDLVVQPGRRVALVGENGAGKSTLLRAVTGRLPRRARLTGTVQAPADLVMLGQEPPFSADASIADVLAATLRPLRHAVAEVERLAADLADPAAATAYDTALEVALAHDAWDADRRAEVAAEQLGLGRLDPTRLVGSLSGGQRTRLALATIMTTRPGCLLLDEPTNHLDDAALEVLADFLTGLPGVVLFASHDRVFLDDVATDLVDLDPSAFGTDGEGGRRFGGGWSDYEEHRRRARERWEATYAQQQEELKVLRATTQLGTEAIAHNRGPRDNDKFIHAFKGANVERAHARRKRDAVQRLEAAEQQQVRKPRALLSFEAPLTAAAGSGRVALVRDLEVAGRLRLDRLDVAAGEHLLVSGGNGTGKSTLLGVLAGRIAPDAGEVQVGARTVAELAQDVVFADPRRSAQATYDDLTPATAPDLLGLGLLHPRDLRTSVGLLSVGQRRRLGLAVAIASGPDLLLLDEPTNHISLALAGELEEAIGSAVGTVVVATHDRWLRRRWTGPETSLE